MLSPLDTDIFLISANVLDDLRLSAKAINPCTDNFRRSRSTGPTNGGSTGSDRDDLQLTDWSSCSVSSVIVGVNWFLFTFSSGVRSIVSGVSGVLGFESSGSDIHILFTAKLSGFVGIGMGTSSSAGFYNNSKQNCIYTIGLPTLTDSNTVILSNNNNKIHVNAQVSVE